MTVHATGFDASIEVLRDLQSRAHDQRPAWAKVSRYLKDTVDEQFTSEGVRLNRRKWKPLSPPYASRKKAAGFSGGVLTRTGELRKSFRHLTVSRNRLVFGSKLDKATWHHEGRGNNPKRPIFNEGRGITRDINRILKNYIENGIV